MAEETGQTMGGDAPRPGEVAPAVDTVETVDLTITPDDGPATTNGSAGTDRDGGRSTVPATGRSTVPASRRPVAWDGPPASGAGAG